MNKNITFFKPREAVALLLLLGIQQFLGAYAVPAANAPSFLISILFAAGSFVIFFSRQFFIKNNFFSNSLTYFMLSAGILIAIWVGVFIAYFYKSIVHGAMNAGVDRYTISLLISFVSYLYIVLYHIVLGKIQSVISVKQTVQLGFLSLAVFVGIHPIVSIIEMGLMYVILNILY